MDELKPKSTLEVVKIQEPEQNFTIIYNYIFEEKTISAKAKGIYCQMIWMPRKKTDGSDWDFSVEGLSVFIKEGSAAIRSAFAELRAAGYMTWEQLHNEKGHIAGYKYTLYTEPQKKTESELSEQMTIADLPVMEVPTKPTKTKKKEKKPDFEAEFEEVWKAYPKKKGKSPALKSYVKARKAGTTKEEIMAGIEAYKAEIKARHTQEQYIKMGSTWFSQKCWEDEYETETDTKGVNNAYRHKGSDAGNTDFDGWYC